MTGVQLLFAAALATVVIGVRLLIFRRIAGRQNPPPDSPSPKPARRVDDAGGHKAGKED
jgi:hypothetical protein